MELETKKQQETREGNIESISKERVSESNAIEIPEISLPKGGGALKGIDEKFKVNAVNGTSGLSIPLPITPGRNNFSPPLSLSYNSGNGNGTFGLGWSLNYPSIQLRTDKQLPTYRGGDQEDVFIFSGVDDLVPFLEENNNEWREKKYASNDSEDCIVKRYRPRIEGGFARIEKICHHSHGVYWKVTSRDNIATIYGRSQEAQIANPKDKTQIFKWLPEFSYDAKGNWIKYLYKKEDLINVPNTHYEKNRINGIAPFTNTYLKSVRYGNRKAYYADATRPYDPQPPADGQYFFELVLDYGAHDLETPSPNANGQWHYRSDAFSTYRSGFEIRTSRLCKRILMFHHFEDEKQFKRTAEEEKFGQNYLVRSLDIAYEPSSINNSGQSETTYLKSIVQSGYVRRPGGKYSKKSLPPMEFEYEKLNWNHEIKSVSPENIVNAPVGLTNNYQWVDLYGEGISGILTEQGEGWHYKSNLGDVSGNGEVTFTPAKTIFSKPSFTGLNKGILSIQDLEANGRRQVVVNQLGVRGYFELDGDSEWKPFTPFEENANMNPYDSNARLIDLNGNGQPDILMTEENVFSWHGANGKKGYSPLKKVAKPYDEEQGSAIVFVDEEQSIFLADMSGDGLVDIVRIRNGEVCYWPNVGYGEFGAKVNMDNPPWFDHPDSYDPQYLHMADISGTGAVDVIYLGKNTFKAFINCSGNSWSDPQEISPFFPMDDHSKLAVVDLLGTGTPCIVWSSSLPSHSNQPMRYIDLMNSKKPHLLVHHKNNMGKETSIQYKSSTNYYLRDKLDGRPWITKLPFPVHVVSKIAVEERITSVRFTTEYKYHHGYYDYHEREFRGFGRVDQIDSEHYAEWSRNNDSKKMEISEELYQKPVLTKTWFHTGAFLERDKILTQFKKEYWHNEYNQQFSDSPLEISEPELDDAYMSGDIATLTPDEYREALRACKGIMLRQEIFALDAPDNPTIAELKLQMKPYQVTTHNCNVQLVQPRKNNRYGVFLVTKGESITITYERDETDFRVTHNLNTKVDEIGNIIESAMVVYGRQQIKADGEFQQLLDEVTDFSEDTLNNDMEQKVRLKKAFEDNIRATKNEQTRTHILYTQNSMAKYHDGHTSLNDIDLAHAYRLRMPYETKTYELTGFVPQEAPFKQSDFENVLSITSEIGYHESAFGGKQLRKIEHTKIKYLNGSLHPLDFGFYDTLGLSYESYQLALTPDLITDIFQKDGIALQVEGFQIKDLIQTKGKYTFLDGNWWVSSGRVHFKEEPNDTIVNVGKRFFVPLAFEDPLGGITKVTYDVESFSSLKRNNDGYYLYIKSKTDAIDNKVQIDIFNYRTMTPVRMLDINGNPSSILVNELGLVKAWAVEGNGIFTDGVRTNVQIETAADSLIGLKEYTEDWEQEHIDQLFGAATQNGTNTGQLYDGGKNLLKQASARFLYDFDNYKSLGRPTSAVSIEREEHFSNNNDSRIRISFNYSDGMGNVAMSKVPAKPGIAFYMQNGQRYEKNTGSELRWIGNGRTVLNNKGNAVKKYDPYFSTSFLYEDAPELVETGVTPIIHYDSLGRPIKTEFPDGTIARVTFDSWKHVSYDQNDTVLESTWYNDRVHHKIDHKLIAGRKDPLKEKKAAQKTEAHANTPSTFHLDSFGRPILNLDHNGWDAKAGVRYQATFVELDTEGNGKSIRDARGNVVMSYKHDMLGNRLQQNSMDAGKRWSLNNILGNCLYKWDERDHVFTCEYDNAQRLISTKVMGGDGNVPLNNIYERIVYGEGSPNEYRNNLRGKVFEYYDTAGKSQGLKFDFKGNALKTSRWFNSDYKKVPNWTHKNLDDPTLFENHSGPYITSYQYDALNRAALTITPDKSETRPIFNEAGLLEQVRVTQVGVSEKIFVKRLDHNAKGQRERIVYGDRNGNDLAVITYHYDQENSRLVQLKTAKANGDIVQDLAYTYDAVGNISEIEDRAVPTRFFGNFKVEPRGLYTYDCCYRLIKADGREHAGQALNFDQCDNWKDANQLKLYSANDDLAWRNYRQEYRYDVVGNLLETKHSTTASNWKRNYSYETNSNRLRETQVGKQMYTYKHHVKQGFITMLPHLQRMDWNFSGRLVATSKQAVCDGGKPPETTYYVYDGSGERVRKITENNNGDKKEERFYVDGIEVYKKHQGKHSGLERTTLHIMDNSGRIAMVDTRNAVNDDTEQRTVRFQFSNHLGSASLELDDLGNTISYEEYHPYGTTSYKAVNKSIRAAAQRYRYTGMERDEESGFGYHSARYYLPWLGRWLSPDPIGIKAGVNVFAYCSQNPIIRHDSSGLSDIIARVITPAGNRTFYHVIDWQRVTFEFPGIVNGPANQMARIQQQGFAVSGVGGGRAAYGPGVYSFPGAGQALSLAKYNPSRPIAVFQVAPETSVETILFQSKSGDFDVYQRILATEEATHIEYTSLEFSNVSDLQEEAYMANVAEEGLEPVPLKKIDPPSSSSPVPKTPSTAESGGTNAPKASKSAKKVTPGGTGQSASRLSKGVKATAKAFGVGLAVVGAAAMGAQIGSGINQVAEGDTAEGSIDIAEGATNLALAVKTTAAVQKGTLVAETGAAGVGVTILAGVAAAGSTMWAFEEARRTHAGEATLAAEAEEHWEDAQDAIVQDGPSVGGAILYVGADFARRSSGFIASGQENLWGLLN